MLHGEIGFVPMSVVMFDFDDFVRVPQGKLQAHASKLLSALHLSALQLHLLEINPDAAKLVEEWGTQKNYSIYVLSHGVYPLESIREKLSNLWITRFLEARTLEDVHTIMRAFHVKAYFSSVVPHKYRAFLSGMTPFRGWHEVRVT